MARWGEGDPRWLVEERADATNVNNWHWSEKNATGWSKTRLRDLLLGVSVEGDNGVSVRISDVKRLEGEATANNRKGKLIFFYEWDIVLSWRGDGGAAHGGAAVDGEVAVPDLSEENDASELTLNVSTKSKSDATAVVLKLMRSKGVKALRECFAAYMRELREEYGNDLIKPSSGKPVSKLAGEKTHSGVLLRDTSDSNESPAAADASVAAASAAAAATASSDSERAVEPKPDVQFATKKYAGRVTFMCAPGDLYACLVQQDRVCAFARSACQVDASVGGAFALFDGAVTGSFTALEDGKSIEQRWRMASWPEAHYSTVTLTLSPHSDGTELKLKQVGIPASDYTRTVAGWDQMYWRPIKAVFGFGSM